MAGRGKEFSRGLGALIVGLEHEYRVGGPSGLCDARVLLESHDFGGRRLDPGDARAVRTPWGLVITADEWEAEVATPPEELNAGFTGRLLDYAAFGRWLLMESLGADYEINGYSTHINVSVPDHLAVQVSWMMLCRFGVAIMFALDAVSSPGVFVRPRRSRVEVGGEYADGDHLVAAMLLCSGAALACLEVAEGRASKASLPPAVRSRVQSSIHRYGWYLDRQAFGFDLYAATDPHLRTWRGQVPAESQVARSWMRARRALESAVDESELVMADEVLMEARGLRAEGSPVDIRQPSPRRPIEGLVLDTVFRDRFKVEAVVATWDVVCFEFSHPLGNAYLTVDRVDLVDFWNDLNEGRLDEVVGSFFNSSAVWN